MIHRSRIPGIVAGAAAGVALALATNASAATLKGQVVGSPYLADSARTAVPVLLSKETARAAHLTSPLGVVVVPRRRLLRMPGGSVLPGNLRVGDKFRGSGRVGADARHAVYPRVALTTFTVTKRSPQLSTAELEALLTKTRTDLANLATTVNALSANTQRAIGDLSARLAAVASDLAAVKGDLATLKANVADLTGRLNTTAASLLANITQVRSDLQTQVTDVATNVQALTTQIGNCAVPSTILGQICTLQNAIASLQPQNISALTDKVTNVSSVLTEMLTDLSGISVSSLPSTLTGTLGTALTGLGSLQGTVGGLTTQLGTMGTTVNGLVSSVSTVTGNVSSVSSTLTNLLGALGASPTGLNPTAVTNLQSSLASAQTTIGGLQTQLGNVNVVNLQSTVSGLSTSLSGVTTKLNSVCSTLSGATAPVTGVVTILLNSVTGTAQLPVISGC